MNQKNSLYKERLKNLLESSMGKKILEFLENDDVVEIMLNDDKKLWIDTLSEGRKFTGIEISPYESERIIKVIATSLGEILNDKNPHLGGELPLTNDRFQGILRPIVENPTFTIRKKALLIFSLEDYLENESLTNIQYENLKKAIKERKNILVVGGTSSGKTTLTNAIIKEALKSNHRMLILEDTQEIQVDKNHDVVCLRTTPTVTMRDLLKITMRMRPDRICVGEIRDGASLDLLKAWNSGHPGGVCTVHADDCESGLDKLEQYCLEISESSQKKLIANTVDICIFIKKEENKRKIHEIKKVSYDKEKNDYKLEELGG
jgi:P-type conjugative transfer ATPase TrbB